MRLLIPGIILYLVSFLANARQDVLSDGPNIHDVDLLQLPKSLELLVKKGLENTLKEGVEMGVNLTKEMGQFDWKNKSAVYDKFLKLPCDEKCLTCWIWGYEDREICERVCEENCSSAEPNDPENKQEKRNCGMICIDILRLITGGLLGGGGGLLGSVLNLAGGTGGLIKLV